MANHTDKTKLKAYKRLIRLYWKQYEIARFFGVSDAAVSQYMKRNGLEIRQR